MSVALASLLFSRGTHPLRQRLAFRQAHQQQMGAVEHLPGDRLTWFQVQGGCQRQGDVGVNLHGAALSADALQAGGVMIFEGGHEIYAIT